MLCMLSHYFVTFQEFLEQEKQNNEEIEKKLTIEERQSIKSRQEYQDLEQSRVQIKDEV